MKNRRNIVEQQNPPQNPNDIWLKDGKFYRSTSQGWTIIDSELEYTDKETMIADNPKSGTIGIDKESGEPSIYNDVTKQWSPLGGGVTETTWQELKNKRDASKLTPGTLYRITDYNCTTTQEKTRSAGHQFDIVLLALSENKLAEEGWAMMNESNVYDVTFSDGVTKKCYLYNVGEDTGGNPLLNVVDIETKLGIKGAGLEEFEIDEINKTAINEDWSSEELTTENLTYNYFQNSNLSAWKVWYCLDNDKSRFAWAQRHQEGSPACITRKKQTTVEMHEFVRNSEIDFIGVKRNYYGWTYDNINIFTDSETPSNGDSVYNAEESNAEGWKVVSFNEGSPQIDEGKGVIYRLIDEWNIDYPCDFKNMQMLIPMDSDDNIDIQNPVRAKYCYAFTDNTSGDPEDLSIKGHAVNIKVKPNLTRSSNSIMYFSPQTLFYTNINETHTDKFSNVTIGKAYVTIFINRGYNINILDNSNNVILKSCGNICIGYDSSNIMFNNVNRSTFGSKCQNIQLTGESDLNYGNNGVELATKNDLN